MCSYDFEYDGRYLSEFGFIICDFSHSSGPDSVTAGSNISFNTVSRTDGKKRNLRRHGFLAFASTSGIAVKAAKKMMQRVIALKPAYRKLFEDPCLSQKRFY